MAISSQRRRHREGRGVGRHHADAPALDDEFSVQRGTADEAKFVLRRGGRREGNVTCDGLFWKQGAKAIAGLNVHHLVEVHEPKALRQRAGERGEDDWG